MLFIDNSLGLLFIGPICICVVWLWWDTVWW